MFGWLDFNIPIRTDQFLIEVRCYKNNALNFSSLCLQPVFLKSTQLVAQGAPGHPAPSEILSLVDPDTQHPATFWVISNTVSSSNWELLETNWHQAVLIAATDNFLFYKRIE